MSVTNETDKIRYNGNGATTVFSFPFKIYEDGDLDVYVIASDGTATLKTITTHYTVSINTTTEGGNVTMVTAPAVGEELFIKRNLAYTQPEVIPNSSNIPETTLENMADRNTMLIQQLNEKLSRAVLFSETSELEDLVFPTPEAGKAIIWNADEDGFENSTDDFNDIVTDATAQADAAADSATDAANSASAAATSATNSANSATASASSATAAAASAASAAATLASAFFRDVVYITSANSPLTVDSTHNGKVLNVNSSGGAVTINLPSIAATTLPFNVAVVLQTAGNNVTINRNGTDTIAGQTSKVLSAAASGCQVTADVDAAPDDWTVMDFGTTADGSIGFVKMAAGSSFSNVKSKTANYTATNSDDAIVCDATSGAITITLPAAVSNSGKKFSIKKSDSSANAVTVDGNGAETIDGATTTTLNTQNETLEIACDGSNWQILSRRIPSEWTNYTPSLSNSTNAAAVGKWKRIGDSMTVRAWVSWSGAGGGGDFTVSLPSGYTIDTAKLPAGTGAFNAGNSLGFFYFNDFGTSDRMGVAGYNDSSTVKFVLDSGGAYMLGTGFASGDDLTVDILVPITGWKG